MNEKNHRYLTKSRFISGTQCSRKLWQEHHQPRKKPPAMPGSIIDLGNKIGRGATTIFEDGIMIEPGIAQEEALNITQDLIADPETQTIFEAAFSYGNTLVRVDILDRINAKQWRLIEVKSGSSIKPHQLTDAAFQSWVLENAGIDVVRVEIAHPNRAYQKTD